LFPQERIDGHDAKITAQVRAVNETLSQQMNTMNNTLSQQMNTMSEILTKIHNMLEKKFPDDFSSTPPPVAGTNTEYACHKCIDLLM